MMAYGLRKIAAEGLTWDDIKSKLETETDYKIKPYDSDVDGEVGILLGREEGAYCAHTRDATAVEKFFEHIMLQKGGRFIGYVWQPLERPVYITASSYTLIKSIRLTNLPVPAGMTAAIGLLARIENLNSTYRTFCKVNIQEDSKSEVILKTDGSTGVQQVYNEKYVDQLNHGTAGEHAFMRLNLWAYVGAGSVGIIYPETTVIIWYEEI